MQNIYSRIFYNWVQAEHSLVLYYLYTMSQWRYGGSIMLLLLEINLSFQQWKNFENPLRTDKIIAKSLV